MKVSLAWAGAVLLLAGQCALAEVTVTATAVNDYDFRGISQTSGSADDSDALPWTPALQIGIDYTADKFYAGIWGSNVDFGDSVDANVEVDLLAGFAGETEGGWRWDVGGTYYMYPGSSPDQGNLFDPDDDKTDVPTYMELYAGGGYGPVDVKYWYSPDLYDAGDSASYLEANASFKVPADISIDVHAGYSFGDYFKALEDSARADDPGYNGDSADYFDWSIGLSRSFGHFDLALKYVDTMTDDYFQVKSGALRNDGRVILSIATTLPWDKAGE
jgi:uncharacterized protein (TIGR02001 family)